MTNARSCTVQQSSVNCRDQCVRMKSAMAFAEKEAGEDYKHVMRRYYGLKRMQQLSSTEDRDGWYPFGRKCYLPNTEPGWRPLAVPLEHLARAAGHAVYQRK